MMQNKLLVKNVLDTFRKYNGRMSIYCFDKQIRLDILNELTLLMINKNENAKIFVVIDDYKYRTDIKERIDNKMYNNLIIITQRYLDMKYKHSYNMFVYIGRHIHENIFTTLVNENRFALALLTENIMDSKFINGVRSICPDANFIIKDQKTDIRQPVEGILCSVTLSDDDLELYKEYTLYTNNTISIFGSIEMINMCRSGDITNNISGAEIRDRLARNNGWSETLDTSQDYQKQIDDIYNPNALYEKACNFFNIADKRRKLVYSNPNKLDMILKLVNEYPNYKILIVSKNDSFANEVSKFLNEEGVECGDYHDDIPDRIDTNDDGTPRYIKSGKNAGKMRIIKSKAISTQDERKFNNSIIRLLSIKSASNLSLCVNCDMIIFTSTMCDDIEKFKLRFRDITINTKPNKVYYLYSADTIEENNVKNLQTIPFLTLSYNEEKNVTFDENSNQIIL